MNIFVLNIPIDIESKKENQQSMVKKIENQPESAKRKMVILPTASIFITFNRISYIQIYISRSLWTLKYGIRLLTSISVLWNIIWLDSQYRNFPTFNIINMNDWNTKRVIRLLKIWIDDLSQSLRAMSMSNASFFSH